MNKKAVIYWFSGTGNTEKVAREYKKNFEENKIETLLYKVGDNFENMPNPQNYDYVGIAYPIHGFNAPYPIFDIIKLFPKTKNKNIFIIKTSGEPLTINNISSEPLIARLKPKGYILTNEYHYIMPYGLSKFCRFAVNVWEVDPAGKADEQVAREGLSCMEVWMKELGLTMNLHELGATEEMLHGIANGTIIMEGGYKVLNHDEVLEILKNSL